MKKTCLMMYLLGILYTQTFAQNGPAKEGSNEIKALNIGDKVPDISFDLINNAKASVKLSDFKGKLVILDFYGLYCSVCVDWMPKTSSLQQAFKDRLQVITVNDYDAPEKIITTFNQYTNSLPAWNSRKFNWKSSELLFAVNASTLNRVFPHMTVPHYIWISPAGKVLAITGHKALIAENIEKFLKNENIQLKIKKEFDAEAKIFTYDQELDIADVEHFSFFKKGELQNISGLFMERIQAGSLRGVSLLNGNLVGMYTFLLNKAYHNKRLMFVPGKSVVIDVKINPLDTLSNRRAISYNKSEARLYTYDLVVPIEEKDNVYEIAINELNKYSGYVGKLDRVKTKCYTLRTIKGGDNFKAKNSGESGDLYKGNTHYMRNLPLSNLVNKFNTSPPNQMKYFVVDETGYKGNVDLEIPLDYSDFIALNNALKKSGLELTEAEREIEIFVIRDKI
jgi:thiol-disulfide isomerase/thioredoxin